MAQALKTGYKKQVGISEAAMDSVYIESCPIPIRWIVTSEACLQIQENQSNLVMNKNEAMSLK